MGSFDSLFGFPFKDLDDSSVTCLHNDCLTRRDQPLRSQTLHVSARQGSEGLRLSGLRFITHDYKFAPCLDSLPVLVLGRILPNFLTRLI